MRRPRLGARWWALIGTGGLGLAVLLIFVLGVTAGPTHPTAPSCGTPQSAHTAPIDADPAVQCLRHAAATCTSREVDINGSGQDNTVDQHIIVAPSDHCRIDDYVTHYLNGIPNTSLDWRCTSFAELPDWGLVLTGCSPPVQCYVVLGSPVIDPPAVPAPASSASGSTVPSSSPSGPVAGAGAPAVSGQRQC